MDEIPETIGERLRLARKLMGLTAKDLGRRAAVSLGRDKPLSESAVRNQENGTNGIPLDVAEAYASILGVTKNWLLFAEPDVPSEARISGVAAVVPACSALWTPHEIAGVKNPIDVQLIGGLSRSSQVSIATHVGDDTLLPEHPSGSLLIFTPLSERQAHAGDIVLAVRHVGFRKEHSVRIVRRGPEGIVLEPFGGTLDQGHKLQTGIEIAGVLELAIRYFEPQSGAPLKVPRSETTENLLTSLRQKG